MNRLILILAIISGIFCVSCQLPMATAFRDNVVPEDVTYKVATAPLLLPPYLILSVLDLAIVNPVRGVQHVPTTTTAIWGWQNENPWIGWGALLPVKLVATPPAVLGTMMFSEQFVYSDEKP